MLWNTAIANSTANTRDICQGECCARIEVLGVQTLSVNVPFQEGTTITETVHWQPGCSASISFTVWLSFPYCQSIQSILSWLQPMDYQRKALLQPESWTQWNKEQTCLNRMYHSFQEICVSILGILKRLPVLTSGIARSSACSILVSCQKMKKSQYRLSFLFQWNVLSFEPSKGNGNS